MILTSDDDIDLSWGYTANSDHKIPDHNLCLSGKAAQAPSVSWAQDLSSFRVQWFTLYYRPFSYIMLPPSTAPPLPLHPPVMNTQLVVLGCAVS